MARGSTAFVHRPVTSSSAGSNVMKQPVPVGSGPARSSTTSSTTTVCVLPACCDGGDMAKSITTESPSAGAADSVMHASASSTTRRRTVMYRIEDSMRSSAPFPNTIVGRRGAECREESR